MNEFSLIDRFVKALDVPPSPWGPGDDCALWEAQGLCCVTTDAVVEGVHFTRAHFSWADIGHKALAVNLSDLAAMGAEPSWFTVALALPPSVTAGDLSKLAHGMSALAAKHGARLVGGNVTAASELSITVTACGTISGKPLLRSGARVGDVLVLSGTVGDAAAGLRSFKSTAVAPKLARAQRRPHPHLSFASSVKAFAHAAIDVSDGLAQDLEHLCRASQVGAALVSDRIPLSRELVRYAGNDAMGLALTGGEDYVLLLAVAPQDQARIEALGGFAIGHITQKRGITLDGTRLTGRLGFMHR
jgi:thiamine-monophosphate kinase